MHKIITLPPDEAQKIAAGQVVDRPANVVKELVENALDAGATVITITMHNAGQSLIRVVDNGCGMSELDALKCFEHHATSKISCFNDLSQLKTFGFRGEALASIAAVSSITLQTRQEHTLQGTQVIGEPGKPFIVECVTCAIGTDIAVSKLFFNVPVRKKFLKKDETESRAIITLVQAFALTYPAIHFQLYSEDTCLLNCPRATDLSNRVAQIWDYQLAKNLLTIDYKEESHFSITGLISNQQLTRYNRNQLFFFVNARWVKNYQLSQALLKGYMPTLQQGRYPVAFIHITVNPSEVDINIHPRKEEVLFTNSLRIEKALQTMVRTSLEQYVSQHLENARVPLEQPATFFSELKQPVNKAYNASRKNIVTETTIFPTTAEITYQTMQPVAQKILEATHQEKQHQQAIVPQEIQQCALEQIEFDVIGIFNKTYILVAQIDGMLMVDQHAAHERILYEQFSKRFNDCAPVQLLFPEVVTLTHEEYNTLIPYLSLFEDNGIMIEPFGEYQVLVQATPVYLKNIAWHVFLQEFIAVIQEEGRAPIAVIMPKLTYALQAQMACKAAVKAGDMLTNVQIQKLLNDLQSTENRFSCPHGRPTSWVLPLHDIEKKFKRKP